ncbi:hypothetical protein RF11_01391 [Thelohanellus kitauei]|uniref:Uncharacterized protein n=1 Tax=Thelohanellus kitauei TaxID=669202 RepID=A0A0C2MWW3_THEKT|nr:hypothetical protein RF11_01391 [Thelohanellus kitauei]
MISIDRLSWGADEASGKCTTTEYRSRLHGKKQREGEAVEDFWDDLRILGDKAYPSLSDLERNDILIDLVIDGLQCMEVKKARKFSPPNSMENALAVAKRLIAVEAECMDDTGSKIPQCNAVNVEKSLDSERI